MAEKKTEKGCCTVVIKTDCCKPTDCCPTEKEGKKSEKSEKSQKSK